MSRGRTPFVLDASAFLAFVWNEPGADVVASVLVDSAISAVNLCEVITKLVAVSGDQPTVIRLLASLNMRVLPWTSGSAEASSRYAYLAQKEFSLGDRACITEGMALSATIVTADRQWAEVPELRDHVRLIR